MVQLQAHSDSALPSAQYSIPLSKVDIDILAQ
jgi:hypothetical protein